MGRKHGQKYLCLVAALAATGSLHGAGLEEIQKFTEQYCIQCHGGEKVKGKVDFTKLLREGRELTKDFETWETVLDVVEHGEMPPEEEEAQPGDSDVEGLKIWYRRTFVDSIEAKPGILKPRRLSVIEFRRTLASLLGFDLKVAIREAEQTVAETSLVMKLLPTDPPGASGFTNDTHGNPISTVAWEQYVFLVDTGIGELFSEERREQLEVFTGKLGKEGRLEPDHAKNMIQNFIPRAWRRPLAEGRLASYLEALEGKEGEELLTALQGELRAALMSPGFLYRGFLAEGKEGTQQPVDPYELAERLSYFIWADMPDAGLVELAGQGKLEVQEDLQVQVSLMLDSPKARSLAEVFALQWLTLDQIAPVARNPHVERAFRTQPLDYIDYLFREDRPLVELIDSKVTFANPYTAGFYPKDRKKLGRFDKRKGIEKKTFPNRKLALEKTPDRGGILTMPGVLQMNKGPIIRGTWMLERILGEHLGEPPADVPPIKGNPKGKKLTFRERFEMHRSEAACAVCHNKIDPLGFALQAYDGSGAFKPEDVDTSGKLPSGETFEDYQGLKKILVTSKKRDLIRNIVERTLSYALCRKLEIHDQPTVNSITDKLTNEDGTFRELVFEVVNSLPFQQAIFPDS